MQIFTQKTSESVKLRVKRPRPDLSYQSIRLIIPKEGQLNKRGT